MFNILVTGSNGQLGSEIKELSSNYPHQFFFTCKENLDMTNGQELEVFIQQNTIGVIINCAAYTAVDKAERDEITADAINHLAVETLAKLCKKYELKLIHVSTDYVFDGAHYQPYVETDIVNPQSVYGNTKLLGEQALLRVNPRNAVIIRTSWVYSSFGTNFVKTMLRLGQERESLGVVFDQVGSPTYARDLAKVILDIIPVMDHEQPQIYHYSNEGVCSWYDFAKAIMQEANITCKVLPIETIQYPTPAQRPYYSLLNKAKIKNEFSLEVPYWRNSLVECLNKMRKES